MAMMITERRSGSQEQCLTWRLARRVACSLCERDSTGFVGEIQESKVSSLQVLPNACHPQPHIIPEAVSKYLRQNKDTENDADVNRYISSHDAAKDCETITA